MNTKQVTTAKLTVGDIIIMGTVQDGLYDATIVSIIKNPLNRNLYEVTLTNRVGNVYPIRWNARNPHFVKVAN